ncbi:MarR family winged helix-turn-helix transcriptional regulator [Vibrio rarus]|uniref:MarR family winged helix-turn-helix transcriptional regulator n=1 Tax=Vibrio rarus TaxID=413403 RepID=UPI0021C4505A|nr:MarR family winged helix-turn-helix transcriptional regulator [Vibrio rarus]
MNKNAIPETIFNIIQSYRHAMRTELQANQLGLNGMHVRCLIFIQQHHQCTANDIVHHFSKDKAQVARLIKEMILNDWIAKAPHPDDKRSQLLSLTEQGTKLSQEIQKAQQNIQAKMQQDLTEEQIQTFIQVAQKLQKNLS